MNEKPDPVWSNRQILALGFCLLGAIGLFHLANAATGKSFYRDSHLGAAVEYAKHGIDLLHPVIIGFNATQTPTPQELPLWQAAVAIGFKVLGPWFGWANLVSLVLFSTCLFPLYQIARTYYSARCACWTMVLFLAQPLVFVYAGMAGTDGFSIASAIWFVFFATRLLSAPRLSWWLLACVAGAVSALSKMPFFLAAGLAIFLTTVLYHRNSLWSWLSMGSVAAVIGIAFIAWTRYTNRCVAGAEFPFVDLRASTPGMAFWYFGDWHYRLSPANWVRGAWRFLNGCFGNLALVSLFLFCLAFLRHHTFAILWLLGAAVSTLIFSHLVLHHWHYYLMFSPAIALICAQAAVAWEEKLTGGTLWNARLGLGIVALVLFFSIVQGLVEMKVVLFRDTYPRKMAEIVKQHCREDDKLLIEGGGWGGEVLMLAHRQGMSIWDTKLLESPDNYERLKKLGYTKLVMISESPLLTAARAITPGATSIRRESYRESMTPVVQNWPTLFESEDILIKELR